ncbi:MAG: hypothetical protein CVV22_00790 [Ignavibacteriae bacterium HGW-Ignavibacteriae-1]|nr:MAG: hypothetical protein CVV22_00790 [Ignavibacteriae bacterium HGW-Ignavibacteriae-1]
MNNSELLHNLFDRSLDSHQEERLFMELASNDELRTEFKQVIDMEFAVRNDFEAFQPAPESQDKIFGALGITTAAVTSGAIATTALTYSGWIAKYLNPILLSVGSLIFGGLLTFLLMNGLSDSGANITSSDNNMSVNHQSPAVSDASANHNIAKIESYIIDTVYKDRIIVKYLPGTERIVYLTKEEETTNANDKFNQITYANYSNSNNPLNKHSDVYSRGARFIDNSGSIYTPMAPFSMYNFLGEKFSVEIKANEDWSVPKADMPRSSYPVFNNTSAALLYKINDNFQVGADVRQEYFYQKYNGVDEKNTSYNYYQHTNYVSGGILARYSFINSSKTRLFVQPTVSLNQVGGVGRVMIGGEYKIVEQVSVVFGLEGSVLQFNHQGNKFYSPKVGFHYGIRLNP